MYPKWETPQMCHLKCDLATQWKAQVRITDVVGGRKSQI
jgi:hypothetical protein